MISNRASLQAQRWQDAYHPLRVVLRATHVSKELIVFELWERSEAPEQSQPALLRIQEALPNCGF